MYFGVDYYPEHWVFPYAGTAEAPESRWEEDVQLMLEAGVNVVRMGEFAWGLYEPEEGRYNFDWMRRAMDLFGDAGIKVVLGTPTAAPPIWLARKHPEILPVDERGMVRRRRLRSVNIPSSSRGNSTMASADITPRRRSTKRRARIGTAG
jgi:beta-galactosidase